MGLAVVLWFGFYFACVHFSTRTNQRQKRPEKQEAQQVHIPSLASIPGEDENLLSRPTSSGCPPCEQSASAAEEIRGEVTQAVAPSSGSVPPAPIPQQSFLTLKLAAPGSFPKLFPYEASLLEKIRFSAKQRTVQERFPLLEPIPVSVDVVGGGGGSSGGGGPGGCYVVRKHVYVQLWERNSSWTGWSASLAKGGWDVTSDPNNSLTHHVSTSCWDQMSSTSCVALFGGNNAARLATQPCG